MLEFLLILPNFLLLKPAWWAVVTQDILLLYSNSLTQHISDAIYFFLVIFVCIKLLLTSMVDA
jgi:hypothetical protein